MVQRMSMVGGQGPRINDKVCHTNLMKLIDTCGIGELVTDVPEPDSVVSVIRPTDIIK